MRCLFLLIISSILNLFVFGQSNKFQELTFSQSIIRNTTTIYDTYSGARSRNETGASWSYGTNANYSLGLWKKLFATIGLGYFDQRFGINRGFDFYEPNVATSLFYTTKNYSYKSFNYFGGIGYRTKISKAYGKIFPLKSELRLSVISNFYNTFQQEFQHDYSGNFLGNPNPQIRKNNYEYGYSFHLKGGLVRPIWKNFKIGIDLALPVYNRFRKDEIFRENTTEYHRVNFSIGTLINLIYNIKN